MSERKRGGEEMTKEGKRRKADGRQTPHAYPYIFLHPHIPTILFTPLALTPSARPWLTKPLWDEARPPFSWIPSLCAVLSIYIFFCQNILPFFVKIFCQFFCYNIFCQIFCQNMSRFSSIYFVKFSLKILCQIFWQIFW